MSDDVAEESEPDAAEGPEEAAVWTRDTAPQTPYTMRQVGLGLVVFAVGAVVAFGIPLALA